MTLESKNINLMCFFVELISPVQIYMWGYTVVIKQFNIKWVLTFQFRDTLDFVRHTSSIFLVACKKKKKQDRR